MSPSHESHVGPSLIARALRNHLPLWQTLRLRGFEEGVPAAPSAMDCVVAVTADTPAAASAAVAAGVALVSARGGSGGADGADGAEGATAPLPRSLHAALRCWPASNVAIISVPGAYAAAEAQKALDAGLHAFVFSDNVPLEAEAALKRGAAARGLLVMGPDCGTAVLDGQPLGFANVTRRGAVGLVGASGTGLQEVACLLHRAGAGVSQLVGVGGRDLHAGVGGTMTRAALRRLADDPATRVLALVSKPPAPQVAAAVLAAAAAAGKPTVVCFLGWQPSDAVRLPPSCLRLLFPPSAGSSRQLAASPVLRRAGRGGVRSRALRAHARSRRRARGRAVPQWRRRASGIRSRRGAAAAAACGRLAAGPLHGRNAVRRSATGVPRRRRARAARPRPGR
jgi:succinyl-CoA synthetase alpha subunit